MTPWDGPTECMAAIRKVLEDAGLELSVAKLLAALKVIGLSFRRSTVQEAADRLAHSPAEPITMRIGARSARLYRFDPDAPALDLVAGEAFDDLLPPAPTCPYGQGVRIRSWDQVDEVWT